MGAMGGCGCTLVAVVGLLGFGGVLGLFISGWMLSSRWETASREAVSRWTGGEVDIGSLGLRYSGVVVSDIEVLADDGLPCVTIDTLRITVSSPWILSEPVISVDAISIEGLHVSLRRDDQGTLLLPSKTLTALRDPSADMPIVRAERVEATSIQGEIDGLVPGSGEALHPPKLSFTASRLDLAEVARTEPVFGRGAGLALAFRTFAIEAIHISAPSSGSFDITQLQLSPQEPIVFGTPLVLRGLSVDEIRWQTSAGSGHLQALAVDAPTLGAVTDFSLISFDNLLLSADGEQISAESVRIDPAAPWIEEDLTLGQVTLRGVNASVPKRWRALLAVAEQLGADTSLPWPDVEVDRLLVIGGLPIGRATLQDVRAEGIGISRSALSWNTWRTGSLVAGPAIGIERVEIASGEWPYAGAPRLSAATFAGVRGAVDPYAPWIGLPSDIITLLPSGISVGTATALDVNASVSLASRSAMLEAESVIATDTVLQPTAWTSRATAASEVTLTVHSSSGELSLQADQLEIGPATLADRPVIPKISASAVDIRSGEDVVAGADRVTFEGTALTVEGGDWWTSLTSAHALTVPSVIREYVPVALGGAQGSHHVWWGIDLTGLPLELHSTSGDAVLHVADRVFNKNLEFDITEWSVGPSGEVVPLVAKGKLARGTFDASGAAYADGKITLSIGAQALEMKEFAPYTRSKLEPVGLELAGGRADLDLEALLNQQRIVVTGSVSVHKVKLSVADRDLFEASGLVLSSNDTLEQEVNIDLACMLDDDPCSPIELITSAVSDALLGTLH